MNCSSGSYFSSEYHRTGTGFSKTQRDLSTRLSEDEMESVYGTSGLTCKELLSRYFYCNFCFDQPTDFLIAYNGKKYNLEVFNSAIGFTDVVITLIIQMQMGSEEYEIYLQEN
tara:strand:+ start:77 stop:415 length:339 start_codon:yes stop_codon:yes gene_type:complete